MITSSKKNLHEGAKKELMDKIMSNEDLLFQWSMLACRVDDSTGMKVLDMVIQLYVNICGFAFATSCAQKEAAEIKSIKMWTATF